MEKLWIAPLEASLELSIRTGTLITSDDIKQLRNRGRIEEEHIQRVSGRLTLYSRQYLLSSSFPVPVKHAGSAVITASDVATWLEQYPDTIAALERQGFPIPYREEAAQIIQERRAVRASRVNLGGRRKA